MLLCDRYLSMSSYDSPVETKTSSRQQSRYRFSQQWHEIKGFVHSDVLTQERRQTRCFRRNEVGVSEELDIESHQFQEKRNEVPTAVNETPVFLALMQITRVSLET